MDMSDLFIDFVFYTILTLYWTTWPEDRLEEHILFKLVNSKKNSKNYI